VKRKIQEFILGWRLNGYSIEVSLKPWQKVMISFLLVTTLTYGIAYVGNGFRAEAGALSWLQKASQAYQKVSKAANSDKAKKIYKWGKRIGVAGAIADVTVGPNFLGESIGFMLGQLASGLEVIVPPPQMLIYNIIEEEDGSLAFIDEDIYQFYFIHKGTLWPRIKAVYYFMSILFWGLMVLAIMWQGIKMILYGGNQHVKLSASDVIKNALFSGISIVAMPWVLNYMFDWSFAFVRYFMGWTNPEFFVVGMASFEVEEPMTNAVLRLVTIFLMFWIWMIYFIRNMAIMILYAGYPIVAFVTNFQPEAMKGWWKEMAANASLQPVHALIMMFAFVMMESPKALEVDSGLYAIGGLLCLIPLTEVIRTAWKAQSIGMGQGIIARAAGIGLGLMGAGSLIGAAAVVGGAARAFQNNAYSSGSVIPGMSEMAKGMGATNQPTSLGGMIARDLRTLAGGFTSAMGAVVGGAVGGRHGIRVGAQLGQSIGQAAVDLPSNFIKNDGVRRAGHQALAWLGERKSLQGLGINSNHHKQMAGSYGKLENIKDQFPLMQGKLAQADLDYSKASAEHNALLSRYSPVQSTWQEVQSADQKLNSFEEALVKNGRGEVKGQSEAFMKNHGGTFMKLYPERKAAVTRLGHATEHLQAAKIAHEAATKGSDPSVIQQSQQRLDAANKEFVQANRQLDAVMAKPEYQQLRAAGWTPDSPLDKHLSLTAEKQQARVAHMDAQQRYGNYEILSQEFAQSGQRLQHVESNRNDLRDQIAMFNPDTIRQQLHEGNVLQFHRDPVVVRELRDATSPRLSAIGGLD